MGEEESRSYLVLKVKAQEKEIKRLESEIKRLTGRIKSLERAYDLVKNKIPELIESALSEGGSE